jgi:hypothetical protein
MWRTGWVVFMIASAGAVTALLAQAFFNGPAFRMPRSIAQPLLAPAPGASPSAAASDRPREIVLRIRIGTAGDAPAVVVEPDAAQR